MAQIDPLLKLALEQRASDIHFSAGEPLRFRVDGELVPVTNENLASETLEKMFLEIMTDAEKERFHKQRNLDKSYTLEGGGFFRVNVFATRRGVAAVLRAIPHKIPTIEDLKLPPAAKTLADSAKGLVLVTGPTGSGKSTTLAALINYINTTYNYHILTAEDPVEFVHVSKKSLINQREIGSSCPTFADALKYALREDPDVILVGEMRDLETIGLALTAAETGHLVFGTLHTRGAGPSVDRIIDSFPANQQAMIRTMLAESLVGVVSQSLLKRIDRSGRVAAFEIMMVNHAISNLIREGKTFQITSIIQTGRKDGMILMDQHILDLVDEGIVDPEEAEAYMEDASPLASRKRGGKKVAAVGGKKTASSEPPAAPAPPTPPVEAKKKTESAPKAVPPAPPPLRVVPDLPPEAAKQEGPVVDESASQAASTPFNTAEELEEIPLPPQEAWSNATENPPAMPWNGEAEVVATTILEETSDDSGEDESVIEVTDFGDESTLGADVADITLQTDRTLIGRDDTLVQDVAEPEIPATPAAPPSKPSALANLAKKPAPKAPIPPPTRNPAAAPVPAAVAPPTPPPAPARKGALPPPPPLKKKTG